MKLSLKGHEGTIKNVIILAQIGILALLRNCAKA